MKNPFIKTIQLLTIIFLFSSCQDPVIGTSGTDDPIIIDPVETPIDLSSNFGDEVSRNFLGNIIDANKNPIEGATITIGGLTASTDENGVFIINNATVYERFGYITAKKSGYIHGSRSVVPTTGTNKITIMMLEEIVAGTTTSGTSETIALSNGASVELNGNYIKPDGTAYTGSVDVILHLLDPSDEDMTQQMPGMLYAANTDNEERMLQTYGMLAVELRGSGDEDLNLAEGEIAEIRIPLDASLIGSAANTIPLWYFDEAKGYWIEEGEATLIGDEYVGTVSHFSFWNCDIPAEAINLFLTITDENGVPVNNQHVTITSTVYGERGGSTNEIGEVNGLVPSNESLVVTFYSYEICGSNPIYTTTIGPFGDDATLDITILSSADVITETVTGTFNNCDGNPVTNGYVILTYGNQQFTDIVTDGVFEITIMRCQDETAFSIEAFDYDNLQSTGEINYGFTTPNTALGTITSCNIITEFITYQIDNDDVIFIANDIDVRAFNGNTDIEIEHYNSNNDCFWIIGNLNDTPPYIGTYDTYEWNVPNDTGFNFIENCPEIYENSTIIYNLTSLGNIGEYIDMNFSGDYEDFQGNPHTITGTIHVIRDN